MSNSNAYLAISLPDSLRQRLHDISVEIKESISRIEKVSDGDFKEETGRLSKSPYEFEEMQLSDLHMTFVFLGESLKLLSVVQLRKWHDSVARIIWEVFEEQRSTANFRLQMTKLELFPPEKHNLVIARFTALTPLLQMIYSRIIDMSYRMGFEIWDTSGCSGKGKGQKKSLKIGGGAALENNSNCKALQKIRELNALEWVPHCTLGKIRAPKQEVEAIGQRAIDDVGRRRSQLLFHHHHQQQQVDDTHVVSGLCLCGATPKQCWIDWEETLRFPGKEESSASSVLEGK